MQAAISPVPSMLFSGALMSKSLSNPSRLVPNTSRRRGRGGPGCTEITGVAGDYVDNWPPAATRQLTYTLGWQGAAVQMAHGLFRKPVLTFRDHARGGCHGVQFKSSPQPVSGRHQVRDRRPPREANPATKCKSIAGIWNFPTAHSSRCRPIRCSANPAPPEGPPNRAAAGTDWAFGRVGRPEQLRARPGIGRGD